jgi:hypothetical protein
MAKPRDNTPIDPRSLTDFTMVLDKFAAAVGSTLEMAGREQIRLMCRDAMTFTPPMPKGGGRGLIDAARRAGANKLGNDVKRIFIPQDAPVKGKSVFLRQVINAVKLGRGAEGGFGAEWLDVYTSQTAGKVRGLSPVLRKIMQDTDHHRAFKKASNYLNKANIRGTYRPVAGLAQDPRPIHDRYKNAVNGRWKRNQPIGGPQYYIDSTAALNAYIAERQRKVGTVKAGWAYNLRQIPKPVSKKGAEKNYGAYNAPWVDSNIRSGTGVFSQSLSKSRVSMTVQNLIGNMNNVAKEANTENIVYGNRIRQMRSAVLQRFGIDIDEANKGKK